MHLILHHRGDTLEHAKTPLSIIVCDYRYFDSLTDSEAKHKDPVANWIRLENSSAKSLLWVLWLSLCVGHPSPTRSIL